MALTREVPTDRWASSLETLSTRNQGRPVRLEASIPPGEGDPLLAGGQPLLGVEFERKGTTAPAVVVTLGGIEPGSPDFTHVITQPLGIWVEQDVDGLAAALEIESRDQGRTRLVFLPEAALPAEEEETSEAVAR